MNRKIKLKQERINKDWSKSELGRRSGVQGGLIGWIESGRFKPYDSQLAKIAKALDWAGDPQELLEEVGINE